MNYACINHNNSSGKLIQVASDRNLTHPCLSIQGNLLDYVIKKSKGRHSQIQMHQICHCKLDSLHLLVLPLSVLLSCSYMLIPHWVRWPLTAFSLYSVVFIIYQKEDFCFPIIQVKVLGTTFTGLTVFSRRYPGSRLGSCIQPGRKGIYWY